MSLPDATRVLAAMEATWPPADTMRAGPWRIREGRGGGKRVSAATAEDTIAAADIPTAEHKMRALGQTPLFMLRPGEAATDRLLGGRGYALVDPVTLYAGPVALFTHEPVRRMTAFTLWPPLAIMRDIWSAGGLGPERIAVMERVARPKTGIFARHTDRPAGVAFAAADGDVAMVHAIEVVPELRKQGVGTNILRLSAHWAQSQGASHIALAVTRSNESANALYSSLGLQVVGHYHYRSWTGEQARNPQ